MKRINDKQANLFLLLGVLIFLFTAGEVFLHLRFPAEKRPPVKPNGWAIIPERSWIEYHPVLGWFHIKNKQAVLQKTNLTVPITTNSLGLRGSREYSLQKPSGISRIYAVGDSFTFGFGVKDEEVFARQMELANSKLEVLNLGVAGYGVDQIHLMLKEFGFDYQPDAVFILIYPEDYWRATRAFNDAGFGKPYFRKMRNGTLQLMHSPVPKEKNFDAPQFPVFLEPSVVDRLFSWSRWYTLLRKAFIRLQKKWGTEDPDSSPEWLLGREILKETVTMVRTHGVEPVLVVVPPQRWFLGNAEPVAESMARFSKREKIGFIDLTATFQSAMQITGHSIDFYYIPDDLHWTAEGHKLVAKTLLEYFQKNFQS